MSFLKGESDMKILLVNDDGYGAKGIVLVEKLLKKYGEVLL